MSERYPSTEDDPRTGKQVGEFDYGGGDVEPVLERQPYWVRIGDMEGWMDPDHDGSFEFNPVDPNDDTRMSGKDYGPKNAAATPDEIPLKVHNMPGDYDEDGNEVGLPEDFESDKYWDDAVYRAKRS